MYYRTTNKPSEVEETERQCSAAAPAGRVVILQAHPLLINTPVVSTLLDSVYIMYLLQCNS